MALTWRNVEGPDFGRSLEGIRTFSNLFGDAIGGLDRGLATFDAAQDKRANAGFAMDLLKYQDPAAYKAALTSGQVFQNVDPRRLNQASIQAAGGRVNELLGQKTAEFGLTRDEFNFDRRKTELGNQDAAAPFVAGAVAAGRQGADAFSKYMAAHPELGKLNYADVSNLATGALDAEAKGVNIDTGRQNFQQGGTRFGWEVTDRATADQADNVLAEISKNSFDAESGISMLNNMKGLNPKVYNAVMGRLGGMPSSGGGTPAAGMIAGATGGGGTAALGLTYGGGALPDSIQNIGQLVANKGALVKSLGASPVGVYQINADTWADFAPKVLGKDWANAPVRDFATQDAIAKRIYESTGGDPAKLMGRWASLDAATAKAIAGKPWEVARQAIAAGESKADPRALALGLTATEQGIRNAGMERNANNPANTYAKSATDGRTVGEVAASLASDPVFKGMDVGYVNEQLRQVQSYARSQKKTINAAVAADILRNSVTSSWASRNLPSIIGGGDRAGVFIDGSAAKQYVREYNQGNIDNTVMANANAAQAQGGQAVAKGAYDAAMARYQAGVAARARGVNVNVQALEGAVNRAAAQLSAATGAIGNNPAIASFNRPQPVAVTRTAGAQPVRAVPDRAPVSRREEAWRRALANSGG